MFLSQRWASGFTSQLQSTTSTTYFGFLAETPFDFVDATVASQLVSELKKTQLNLSQAKNPNSKSIIKPNTEMGKLVQFGS